MSQKTVASFVEVDELANYVLKVNYVPIVENLSPKYNTAGTPIRRAWEEPSLSFLNFSMPKHTLGTGHGVKPSDSLTTIRCEYCCDVHFQMGK